MLNILVLEDDYAQYKIIYKYIKSYDSKLSIHYAKNIAEAYSVIENITIDIFILDVKLPDGLGIDFAKKIRKISQYSNAWIIFITGFKKAIQNAVGTRFIDFIVKPFTKKRFFESLDFIIDKNYSSKIEEKISIETKSINYIFNSSDIIYIEIINSKLNIVTANKKYVLNRYPLNSLKKQLSKEKFIQCFRSIIVNVSYVQRLIHTKELTEIELMHLDERLPVGGVYKERLQKCLEHKVKI